MDFNFLSGDLSDALWLYVPRVVGALLLLIIGFWIAGKLGNLLNRRLASQGRIDPTVAPFLRSIVVTGFKILVILAVASMLGIETTSFLAIFSAVAFAIGLALSGTLGHFASGVLLLVFRPYRVGDVVTIGGGETGVVLEIQIFNTILRNADNNRIIIPNAQVTGNVIKNLSGQETMGVTLTFGIGYDDDIDRAREIILRVSRDCPYTILPEPAQAVVVSELGDSSVNLTTRPYVASSDFWPTKFYLLEHVKKAFDQEGISIPYPQRDVHLIKE